MSSNQSPATGQSSVSPNPRLESWPSVGTGHPVDIVLVGDISKPSSPKIWGKPIFPWPEKIPSVDICELIYAADDVVTEKTRAKAVETLEMDISEKTLQVLSCNLQNLIINKKKRVILVGYGYGGLLCEQAIVNIQQKSPASSVVKGLVLFGTPHFVQGLKQWSRIVVETTMQPEAGITTMRETARAFIRGRAPSGDLAGLEKRFGQIAEMQRSFFRITRDDGWGARIASCFPMPSTSTSRQKPTISPEWSVIPHAMPVLIRKPYLEMTAFDDEKEHGFQVIS